MKCSTCGRTLPKAKPGKAEILDTSQMTDAELFTYYRHIAPVTDLEFFLRHAEISPAVRADAEALLNGPRLPRTEHYRQLGNLQDRSRRERVDAEIAAGPGHQIGSEE